MLRCGRSRSSSATASSHCHHRFGDSSGSAISQAGKTQCSAHLHSGRSTRGSGVAAASVTHLCRRLASSTASFTKSSTSTAWWNRSGRRYLTATSMVSTGFSTVSVASAVATAGSALACAVSAGSRHFLRRQSHTLANAPWPSSRTCGDDPSFCCRSGSCARVLCLLFPISAGVKGVTACVVEPEGNARGWAPKHECDRETSMRLQPCRCRSAFAVGRTAQPSGADSGACAYAPQIQDHQLIFVSTARTTW